MIEVYTSNKGDLQTIVLDTPQSIARFKQLVQHGANLWADAPPEIKELADLVTTGRILQDYKSQDTSKN